VAGRGRDGKVRRGVLVAQSVEVRERLRSQRRALLRKRGNALVIVAKRRSRFGWRSGSRDGYRGRGSVWGREQKESHRRKEVRKAGGLEVRRAKKEAGVSAVRRGLGAAIPLALVLLAFWLWREWRLNTDPLLISIATYEAALTLGPGRLGTIVPTPEGVNWTVVPTETRAPTSTVVPTATRVPAGGGLYPTADMAANVGRGLDWQATSRAVSTLVSFWTEASEIYRNMALETAEP